MVRTLTESPKTPSILESYNIMVQPGAMVQKYRNISGQDYLPKYRMILVDNRLLATYIAPAHQDDKPEDIVNPLTGRFDLCKGIQIFVKDPNGKCHTFDTYKEETVIDLKRKIEGRTGMPAHEQRLVYVMKQLDEDHKCIGDYGITKESMIYALYSVRGGMHLVVHGRNDYEASIGNGSSDSLSPQVYKKYCSLTSPHTKNPYIVSNSVSYKRGDGTIGTCTIWRHTECPTDWLVKQLMELLEL